MKKYLLINLLSALVLVFYLARAWPDRLVHLVVCDVGQGDAILLTTGFTQVLIDGGRGEQVLTCLEEKMPFWDRTLELMVLTHADGDHYGGLVPVLGQYRVAQIMAAPFDKETAGFAEFKQAVEVELGQGAVLKKPILGAQMRFSQDGSVGKWYKLDQKWWGWRRRPPVEITTLSPRVEAPAAVVENLVKPKDTLSDVKQFFSYSLPAGAIHNNQSLVWLIKIGRVTALLTGDLEVKGELALIEQNLLKSVDILKVGHHGSKTSTSQQFLEAVQPETSLISVGQNNSYGHPSPEVLNRLIQFGGKILRTDQQGTIELVSDGQKYWLVD